MLLMTAMFFAACSSHVASSSSLAVGLSKNVAAHATELADSADLGFARAASGVPVPLTHSFQLDRAALGMGRACPFESDELVFATDTAIFSEDECSAVRNEAAAKIAAGAKSTFTMTDTNEDVGLHDLPETLRWLNDGAFARVTSLAAKCFPGAVDDPTKLFVYRGLCIHYNAAAGLTHQPIHRDGALISCVVPLSKCDEYDGGGTYLEPLGRSFALEQGHALLHPSSVRHAGHRITSGERWVMVLFMNHVEMRYGEHGRRFRARAQEVFEAAQEAAEQRDGPQEKGEGEEEAEEEEVDEELECLLHALEVTDETDHEVWYDLGARAHEAGDTTEALRLYERASALNPADPLLLGNMGVAMLELGRPRDALRSYRRALAVDRYNTNALFNAGELMLETGRLRGLRALLEQAPDEVREDEGLLWLAEELHAATK